MNTPYVRRLILLVLIGGLSLLLGWGMVGLVTGTLQLGTPSLHGTLIEPSQPINDFTLNAHTGESVSLSSFRGKVVLIYFGYTYCPDVCPTTLNELNQAVNELASTSDEVQILMVSLDPERDTPQVLADYLAHFHPSFLGLSGTDEELVSATKPLGIYYERQAGTAVSGYTIDHTSSVVVLDQQGHLRLIIPFETDGKDIASDLRYLIRQK